MFTKHYSIEVTSQKGRDLVEKLLAAQSELDRETQQEATDYRKLLDAKKSPEKK